MLFDIPDIEMNKVENELFSEKGIELHIYRFDEIHPIVSGNKLFKLNFFLEECIQSNHKKILTFGGAYSNHLIATAFVCNKYGLRSIGIVRGEKPLKLSHTLEQCKLFGMQLEFVPREIYANKNDTDFIDKLKSQFGMFTLVPEGGFHPLGAKGAALMLDFIEKDATHICAATGTATTIAGLLLASKKDQHIIAVNVLKGITDTHQQVSFLTENKKPEGDLIIMNDYHFGGYAKYTSELIDFMNNIYNRYQIPLDFVYTGKMLFAIFDQIKKGIIPKGSKIACLHTGGLQGNLSLPKGAIIF